MMGQPVFSAILKLPSLKGEKLRSHPRFVFRVPSGKIHMEIPPLICSMPVRMVLSPSLMSVRFRNKTVKTFHPCGKKRDFFQTVLCHIAGEPGTAGVGDDDVEEAPVVSDIKDRNVLRHMFLADDRYFVFLPATGAARNMN